MYLLFRQAADAQPLYPVQAILYIPIAGTLPSGIYFARLEAGDFSQSIKLVLLK